MNLQSPSSGRRHVFYPEDTESWLFPDDSKYLLDFPVFHKELIVIVSNMRISVLSLIFVLITYLPDLKSNFRNSIIFVTTILSLYKNSHIWSSCLFPGPFVYNVTKVPKPLDR
jgi:hypothetical protein